MLISNLKRRGLTGRTTGLDGGWREEGGRCQRGSQRGRTTARMEEAFAWLLPEQARGRKGRSVVNRLYHGGDAAASARPGAEWSGGERGDQGRIRAQSPTRQNSAGCFQPVLDATSRRSFPGGNNPLMPRHTRIRWKLRALNGRWIVRDHVTEGDASRFFFQVTGRRLLSPLLYAAENRRLSSRPSSAPARRAESVKKGKEEERERERERGRERERERDPFTKCSSTVVGFFPDVGCIPPFPQPNCRAERGGWLRGRGRFSRTRRGGLL